MVARPAAEDLFDDLAKESQNQVPGATRPHGGSMPCDGRARPIDDFAEESQHSFPRDTWSHGRNSNPQPTLKQITKNTKRWHA